MVEEALKNYVFQNVESYSITILSRLPIPVMVINADTSIEYVNSALEKYIGFSSDELIGARVPYPWWPEETHHKVIIDFGEAMHGKVPKCEQPVIHKNGEKFWAEIINTPIVIENGVKHYISLYFDITAHKLMEDKFKASRERYRRLSEAAFEGIVIHDNMEILDVNHLWAEMYGYELSEVIGHNLLDFVAPEHHELVKTKVFSGNEESYENMAIRKDGTRLWVESRGKKAYFQGRPVRIGSVKDITRDKQTEAKLAESVQKLQSMFESIVEGVIFCDLEGYITQLNDAAVKLHGYHDKEELIGQQILKLIAEKDHSKARSERKKALEKGRAFSREYTCLTKAGIEFEVELSIAVLNNKDKEPAGFILVTRDITERKRQRDTMISYISAISRAQEEERKRVARELHDETLQSLASLSLDIEATIGSEANLSENTIRKMTHLLDKSRDIMKEIRRFSHELRPAILDKLGLIPALEMLIDETKRESNIRASIEIIGTERRLPSNLEMTLFRIVQEALRNVRKHAEATAVRVEAKFLPGKIEILISDNGKGFQVPRRLSVQTYDGELGLIGIQERVRLLGGKFSIKSSMGEGTSLWLEIPDKECNYINTIRKAEEL